ncbi:MAG: LysM peptidoglycan-binding domain-containing protein [Coraliomargaritaceae bacterium]|jgi:LysM repeat protein
MNTSKVFGFILALHVGVISILFVQPGCQSSVQAPTQSDYQLNSLEQANSEAPSALDLAYQESSLIDASLSESDYDQLNEIEGVFLEEEAFTVSVNEVSMDTYTIQSGDTLWDLAKRFDTTVAELCELNGLNKDSVLQIGRVIDVPTGDSKEMEITKETATLYQPSTYEGVGQSYLIASGDSLSRIAKKFGTTVDALKAANSLTSDRIYSGQKLLIPVDGVVVEAPAVETVEVSVEEAPVAVTAVEPVATEVTSSSIVQEAEPLDTFGSSIEDDLSNIEALESGEINFDDFEEVELDYVNVGAEE